VGFGPAAPLVSFDVFDGINDLAAQLYEARPSLSPSPPLEGSGADPPAVGKFALLKKTSVQIVVSGTESITTILQENVPLR
jgi:hypothetical protein